MVDETLTLEGDVPSATATHVIILSFAATSGCVASLEGRLPPRAPPLSRRVIGSK